MEFSETKNFVEIFYGFFFLQMIYTALENMTYKQERKKITKKYSIHKHKS